MTSLVKRSSFFRFTSLLTVSVFLWTNVVWAAVESGDFWNERRRSIDRMQNQTAPVSSETENRSSSPSSDTRFPEKGPLQFAKADGLYVPPAFSPSIPTGSSLRLQDDLSRMGFSTTPAWLSRVQTPYAEIVDVFLSQNPNAPRLVVVQDVHEQAGAQTNIARLLGHLSKGSPRGSSLLVGLEGAQGPFALDVYRRFPDPAVRDAVARHLLQSNVINGAEFVGMTADSPTELWGVEDNALYGEHVAAFKESVPSQAQADALLTDLKIRVSRLRERIYSPALARYIESYQAFHENRISLSGYVSALLESGAVVGDRYPQLALFAGAIRYERTLDFKKVEQQRQRLMGTFADRLDERHLQSLLSRSLDYRVGRIGYADYYGYLKGLCALVDVRLEEGKSSGEYSEFCRYIQYVLLTERIEGRALFDELSLLEEGLFHAMVVNPEEKTLSGIDRALPLLQKLTTQSLTTREWMLYQKFSGALRISRETLSRIEATPSGEAVSPEEMGRILSLHEKFYSVAVRRNDVMVSNLIGKLKGRRSAGASDPSAVLVAGGFHTEGVSRLLKDSGVSYVVLSPRLETVSSGQRSLDYFRRGPTDLEKLFAGEKLFLNTPRPGAAVMPSGYEKSSQMLQRYFSALAVALKTVSVHPEQAERTSAELVRWIQENLPSGKGMEKGGAFVREYRVARVPFVVEGQSIDVLLYREEEAPKGTDLAARFKKGKRVLTEGTLGDYRFTLLAAPAPIWFRWSRLVEKDNLRRAATSIETGMLSVFHRFWEGVRGAARWMVRWAQRSLFGAVVVVLLCRGALPGTLAAAPVTTALVETEMQDTIPSPAPVRELTDGQRQAFKQIQVTINTLQKAVQSRDSVTPAQLNQDLFSMDMSMLDILLLQDDSTAALYSQLYGALIDFYPLSNELIPASSIVKGVTVEKNIGRMMAYQLNRGMELPAMSPASLKELQKNPHFAMAFTWVLDPKVMGRLVDPAYQPRPGLEAQLIGVWDPSMKSAIHRLNSLLPEVEKGSRSLEDMMPELVAIQSDALKASDNLIGRLLYQRAFTRLVIEEALRERDLVPASVRAEVRELLLDMMIFEYPYETNAWTATSESSGTALISNPAKSYLIQEGYLALSMVNAIHELRHQMNNVHNVSGDLGIQTDMKNMFNHRAIYHLPLPLGQYTPLLDSIWEQKSSVKEDNDYLAAVIENGKIFRYFLASESPETRKMWLSEVKGYSDAEELARRMASQFGDRDMLKAPGSQMDLRLDLVIAQQLYHVILGIQAARNVKTAAEAQALFFKTMQYEMKSKSPTKVGGVKTWADYEKFIKDNPKHMTDNHGLTYTLGKKIYGMIYYWTQGDVVREREWIKAITRPTENGGLSFEEAFLKYSVGGTETSGILMNFSHVTPLLLAWVPDIDLSDFVLPRSQRTGGGSQPMTRRRRKEKPKERLGDKVKKWHLISSQTKLLMNTVNKIRSEKFAQKNFKKGYRALHLGELRLDTALTGLSVIKGAFVALASPGWLPVIGIGIAAALTLGGLWSTLVYVLTRREGLRAIEAGRGDLSPPERARWEDLLSRENGREIHLMSTGDIQKVFGNENIVGAVPKDRPDVLYLNQGWVMGPSTRMRRLILPIVISREAVRASGLRIPVLSSPNSLARFLNNALLLPLNTFLSRPIFHRRLFANAAMSLDLARRVFLAPIRLLGKPLRWAAEHPRMMLQGAVVAVAVFLGIRSYGAPAMTAKAVPSAEIVSSPDSVIRDEKTLLAEADVLLRDLRAIASSDQVDGQRYQNVILDIDSLTFEAQTLRTDGVGILFEKMFPVLLAQYPGGEQWMSKRSGYQNVVIPRILGRLVSYGLNRGSDYVDGMADPFLSRLLTNRDFVMALVWGLDHETASALFVPDRPVSGALSDRLAHSLGRDLLVSLNNLQSLLEEVEGGASVETVMPGVIGSYRRSAGALADETRILARILYQRACARLSIEETLRDREMVPDSLRKEFRELALNLTVFTYPYEDVSWTAAMDDSSAVVIHSKSLFLMAEPYLSWSMGCVAHELHHQFESLKNVSGHLVVFPRMTQQKVDRTAIFIPIDLGFWQPYLKSFPLVSTPLPEDIGLLGASIETGKIFRFLWGSLDSAQRASLRTAMDGKRSAESLAAMMMGYFPTADYMTDAAGKTSVNAVGEGILTQFFRGWNTAHQAVTPADAERLYFDVLRDAFGSSASLRKVRTWDDWVTFAAENTDYMRAHHDESYDAGYRIYGLIHYWTQGDAEAERLFINAVTKAPKDGGLSVREAFEKYQKLSFPGKALLKSVPSSPEKTGFPGLKPTPLPRTGGMNARLTRATAYLARKTVAVALFAVLLLKGLVPDSLTAAPIVKEPSPIIQEAPALLMGRYQNEAALLAQCDTLIARLRDVADTKPVDPGTYQIVLSELDLLTSQAQALGTDSMIPVFDSVMPVLLGLYPKGEDWFVDGSPSKGVLIPRMLGRAIAFGLNKNAAYVDDMSPKALSRLLKNEDFVMALVWGMEYETSRRIFVPGHPVSNKVGAQLAGSMNAKILTAITGLGDHLISVSSGEKNIEDLMPQLQELYEKASRELQATKSLLGRILYQRAFARLAIDETLRERQLVPDSLRTEFRELALNLTVFSYPFDHKAWTAKMTNGSAVVIHPEKTFLMSEPYLSISLSRVSHELLHQFDQMKNVSGSLVILTNMDKKDPTKTMISIPIDLGRWQHLLQSIPNAGTTVHEDADLLGASIESGKILRYLLATQKDKRRVWLSDLIKKGLAKNDPVLTAFMMLQEYPTEETAMNSDGATTSVVKMGGNDIVRVLKGAQAARDAETASLAEELYFRILKESFGPESPFVTDTLKTWDDFERILLEHPAYMLENHRKSYGAGFKIYGMIYYWTQGDLEAERGFINAITKLRKDGGMSVKDAFEKFNRLPAPSPEGLKDQGMLIAPPARERAFPVFPVESTTGLSIDERKSLVGEETVRIRPLVREIGDYWMKEATVLSPFRRTLWKWKLSFRTVVMSSGWKAFFGHWRIQMQDFMKLSFGPFYNRVTLGKKSFFFALWPLVLTGFLFVNGFNIESVRLFALYYYLPVQAVTSMIMGWTMLAAYFGGVPVTGKSSTTTLIGILHQLFWPGVALVCIVNIGFVPEAFLSFLLYYVVPLKALHAFLSARAAWNNVREGRANYFSSAGGYTVINAGLATLFDEDPLWMSLSSLERRRIIIEHELIHQMSFFKLLPLNHVQNYVLANALTLWRVGKTPAEMTRLFLERWGYNHIADSKNTRSVPDAPVVRKALAQGTPQEAWNYLSAHVKDSSLRNEIDFLSEKAKGGESAVLSAYWRNEHIFATNFFAAYFALRAPDAPSLKKMVQENLSQPDRLFRAIPRQDRRRPLWGPSIFGTVSWFPFMEKMAQSVTGTIEAVHLKPLKRLWSDTVRALDVGKIAVGDLTGLVEALKARGKAFLLPFSVMARILTVMTPLMTGTELIFANAKENPYRAEMNRAVRIVKDTFGLEMSLQKIHLLRGPPASTPPVTWTTDGHVLISEDVIRRWGREGRDIPQSLVQTLMHEIVERSEVLASQKGGVRLDRAALKEIHDRVSTHFNLTSLNTIRVVNMSERSGGPHFDRKDKYSEGKEHPGYVNFSEAAEVYDAVKGLLDRGVPPQSVVITAPYQAQLNVIRYTFKKNNLPIPDGQLRLLSEFAKPEVLTETDKIVIISTVRSTAGILEAFRHIPKNWLVRWRYEAAQSEHPDKPDLVFQKGADFNIRQSVDGKRYYIRRMVWNRPGEDRWRTLRVDRFDLLNNLEIMRGRAGWKKLTPDEIDKLNGQHAVRDEDYVGLAEALKAAKQPILIGNIPTLMSREKLAPILAPLVNPAATAKESELVQRTVSDDEVRLSLKSKPGTSKPDEKLLSLGGIKYRRWVYAGLFGMGLFMALTSLVMTAPVMLDGNMADAVQGMIYTVSGLMVMVPGYFGWRRVLNPLIDVFPTIRERGRMGNGTSLLQISSVDDLIRLQDRKTIELAGEVRPLRDDSVRPLIDFMKTHPGRSLSLVNSDGLPSGILARARSGGVIELNVGLIVQEARRAEDVTLEMSERTEMDAARQNQRIQNLLPLILAHENVHLWKVQIPLTSSRLLNLPIRLSNGLLRIIQTQRFFRSEIVAYAVMSLRAVGVPSVRKAPAVKTDADDKKSALSRWIKGLFFSLIAAGLFGLNYTFAEGLFHDQVSVASVLFLETSIGLTALTGYYLFQRVVLKKPVFQGLLKIDRRKGLYPWIGATALNYMLVFPLFFQSFLYTTSLTATLISMAYPMFVLVFSWMVSRTPFFKKIYPSRPPQMNRAVLFGSFLILMGTLINVLTGSDGVGQMSYQGGLLALMSTVSGALYLVMMDGVSKHMDGVQQSYLSSLFGLLFVSMIPIVTSAFGQIDYAHMGSLLSDPRVWGLGLTNIVASIFYFLSVKHLSAYFSGLIMTGLEAVMVGVFSLAMFGRIPPVTQIAAYVLVLAGIIGVKRKPSSQDKVSVEEKTAQEGKPEGLSSAIIVPEPVSVSEGPAARAPPRKTVSRISRAIDGFLLSLFYAMTLPFGRVAALVSSAVSGKIKDTAAYMGRHRRPRDYDMSILRTLRYQTSTELPISLNETVRSFHRRTVSDAVTRILRAKKDRQGILGGMQQFLSVAGMSHSWGRSIVSEGGASADLNQMFNALSPAILETIPPVEQNMLGRFEVRLIPSTPDMTKSMDFFRLMSVFGGVPMKTSELETLSARIASLRGALTQEEKDRLEEAYVRGRAVGQWAHPDRLPQTQLGSVLNGWREQTRNENTTVQSFDVSGLLDLAEGKQVGLERIESLKTSLINAFRAQRAEEKPLPVILLSRKALSQSQTVALLRTFLPEDLTREFSKNSYLVLSGKDVRSWHGMDGLMDPDRILSSLEKKLGQEYRMEIFTDDAQRWKKDWRAQARILLVEIVSAMDVRLFRSMNDIETELRGIKLLQIQA
ncbi:MAG TPA: hypothetical protein PK876_06760 [Elusimicrobiota bacterium]|nr:hypothetical protein [Elusimicrobiota bacterium]